MAEPEFEFRVGESTWRLHFGDVTMGRWMRFEREIAKHAPGMTHGELAESFTSRFPSALSKTAFWWLARLQSGEQIEFDSPALDVKAKDLRVAYIGASADDEPAEEPAESPDPTGETAPPSHSAPK